VTRALERLQLTITILVFVAQINDMVTQAELGEKDGQGDVSKW